MTKRLSIALVAVALFVLLAVMPVSAVTTTNANGTQIDLGATVFIGEEHLNLTHALNGVDLGAVGAGNLYDHAPTNLTIGWWASAAALTTTAPTKTINLGNRYMDFQVAPSDFVGYTGNWYSLGADGTTAQKGPRESPVAVFNCQDPTLSVGVWDFQQSKDVTGLSIPQGEHLGVQVNTNMYAATYTNRNNTKWAQFFNAMPYNFDVMPNGIASAWGDANYSGTPNGSYVYSAYTGKVAGSNVWLVRNYSNSTAVNPVIGLTWKDDINANTETPLGGAYTYAYFNNSPMPANSEFPSQYYTAQNFTTDAAGVRSMYLAAQGLDVTVPMTVGATQGGWAESAPTWDSFNVALLTPFAGSDGYITLKVKDESGATLDKLYVGSNTEGNVQYNLTGITKQFVDKQPWYFGAATQYWVTDAVDTNNQYAYPVGTYSIWAESLLNNMKDNYKNAGADYTGKTVSATGTVTLVSNSVKIEANKDSVVRSKSFSVTVTGKPSTTYYVWVKGTRAMDSLYDNQPPMVKAGQEKVYFDDSLAASLTNTHPIGNYAYENGAGDIIYNDVAASTVPTFNKTRYYALINTSTSGTRVIEFVTNNWTKAQKYTIRVEQTFGTDIKSDEVDINVEKGAVTIVAAGDQSYYLGEEIKFSGTNTETYKTYLFLIGPNLPDKGAVIWSQDPRNALMGSSFTPTRGTKGVINNDEVTFKVVDVNGDNTWSWKWGTANYALDAGTYTIYAVSQPYDRETLENAAYGTVSIIIKKPFVSATASQSTVAKGDRVYISGTAEGDPSSVAVWIMGKNFARLDSASVNSDASFKYEVKQEVTKNLASGQYFVVVQHPMQNKVFDVTLNGNYVVNRQLTSSTNVASGNYSRIFTLLGPGSLQGSDAAEALAQGINDANVDDTYTKLQFLVEEPVIRIDAIGDKHVGDKFTITAQTNLAVDDEVLVQVYSSSFKPTQKSQSGEFSGATGTVKVTKGDSGMNKISFDVDSSTFKPDEYIVTEDAVIQEATGTALFNVLETSVTVATTAAPVVTTAAPVVTTAAPVVTTAAPVTTTKPSPGFGALIALIGLGAVAFVVVRRH